MVAISSRARQTYDDLPPSARSDFYQLPRFWVDFRRVGFGRLVSCRARQVFQKIIITCPAVSINWNDNGSSSTVKCTKILCYRNEIKIFFKKFYHQKNIVGFCHQFVTKIHENFGKIKKFDSRTSISMPYTLFHLWLIDFRFHFYSSNATARRAARFRFYEIQ